MNKFTFSYPTKVYFGEGSAAQAFSAELGKVGETVMEKILNHYNAYISKACLRPCYDEYGNIRIVVDMDLKGRVRTAIMKAILNFELEIK